MATQKPIDWTKPVHFSDATGVPVTVLAHYKGRAFITWGSAKSAYEVDECGNVAVSDPSILDRLFGRIENVPEAPKNCIHVYMDALTKRWEVNNVGPNVQLRSRADWDMDAIGGVVVEVPVDSK